MDKEKASKMADSPSRARRMWSWISSTLNRIDEWSDLRRVLRWIKFNAYWSRVHSATFQTVYPSTVSALNRKGYRVERTNSTRSPQEYRATW